MTSADFTALAPLIVLALTPIAVMLSIAVHRRHSVSLGISFLGLVLAFAGVFTAKSAAPHAVSILFHVDTYGLFYIALIIGIAGVVLALGYSYLAHRESQPEEYYILVLIATAGAGIMAISTHFVSFYLGLEILSVSLYGLIAYFRRDHRGTEAGLKYLVLAAGSAAFLLFGMALVYAELGTMDFAALAHATTDQIHNKVVLLGVAMMFASIGFKLSIAPFHYWTPDIYEGAPASIAAFIATAGKIGVLAVVTRYFVLDTSVVSHALQQFVVVTAAASMIVGNLLAIIQTSIKRLLAYSSIAHMGYLSIVLLVNGADAGDTVAFYMLAYSAATLGAFGVIMTMSTGFGHAHDLERIEDYRGLYWRSHALGLVFAISLLSLAGIPLTAGFLGKLYIVLAGAQTGKWWLLIVLALSSAAGVYYYLRVVAIIFSKIETAEPGDAPLARIHLSLGNKLLLGGLAAVTLFIGAYPAPLLDILHRVSSAALR